MLFPNWLGGATGATQMLFAKGRATGARRARPRPPSRRTRTSKKTRMKMATRLSKPKRRALVKGSAAAKRYMAMIRRKRK